MSGERIEERHDDYVPSEEDVSQIVAPTGGPLVAQPEVESPRPATPDYMPASSVSYADGYTYVPPGKWYLDMARAAAEERARRQPA